MCVIIILDPGQSIPYNMLENACYNNWHSYGLVVKVDNKLDVIKKVPESGEVDPEEVAELLDDNKEYERILHLRHNTAGATNMENTHPFDVFYHKSKRKERQVVFMHNGTLYTYKSKIQNAMGTLVDDEYGPSDTKNYVDKVLIPLLAGTDFGKGTGDISSPLIREVLKNMWPIDGENRGILISNDQDDFLLGTWKTIKPFENDEDTWFKASNDSYFEKVIRGPEYERREEEAKKNKKDSVRLGTATSAGISDLKDFTIDGTHGFYKLSESICDILCDWDLYDRENATSLGYATREEIGQIYDSSREDTISLLEWITGDYATMYDDLKEIEEKHKKATKKISELVWQNKELRDKLEGKDKRKVG